MRRINVVFDSPAFIFSVTMIVFDRRCDSSKQNGIDVRFPFWESLFPKGPLPAPWRGPRRGWVTPIPHVALRPGLTVSRKDDPRSPTRP